MYNTNHACFHLVKTIIVRFKEEKVKHSFGQTSGSCFWM